MTFSARDALLDDDEEWFNIPFVVRSFLRQLNNEVQNNRLTYDNLLRHQEEHDKLIKGVVSKQMEREFEMTKTVLVLQQDQQEIQTSLHKVVDNIRLQMHQLSEEQQQIRERIRQIEERENDIVSIRDSLRAQSNNFAATINRHTAELETTLRGKLEELSNVFGVLEKTVHVISEKQDKVVTENKMEFMRYNAALQQLCDTVAEEVDNIRDQIREHQQVLSELKELSHEDQVKGKKYERKYSRLFEKVADILTSLRHLQVSSEDRFESVFSTMTKLQALTEKLSAVNVRRGEDHSSLLAVLQENQDMHGILAEEFRVILKEHSTRQQKELNEVKGQVDDLLHSRDMVMIVENEKNTTLRISIEEIRQRLDSLESLVTKTNLKNDVDLLNNVLTNEKTTRERWGIELQQSLFQQKGVLHSEIEFLKTSISNLNVKCEAVVEFSKRTGTIEENMQMLLEQIHKIEKNIDNTSMEVNNLSKEMETCQAKFSTMVILPDEKNLKNTINLAKDEPVSTRETDLKHITSLLEDVQHKLSTYDATLKEIQQSMLRYDNLVVEIPRSCQRYIENVDQKLSPALLELDVLRKRVASIELQSTSLQTHEEIHSPSRANKESDELEGLRSKLRQNQSLQSFQRQLQAVEVRMDGVQALSQGVERKVEALSNEISEMSVVLSSIERKENNRVEIAQCELKRVLTQMDKMEAERRLHENRLASDHESLVSVTVDLKTLEASFHTVSSEIRGLEKALKECITSSSVEWREVAEKVLELSTNIKGNNIYGCSVENEIFAPMSKVLAIEEMMSQFRKEQNELGSRLEVSEKAMIQRASDDSELSRHVNCDRLLTSLDRRVGQIEGILSNEKNSIVAANISDELPSFRIRMKSIEKAVDELQSSVFSLPPSSALQKVVVDGVVLSERLLKLEGVVTTKSEQEKNSFFSAAGPVLLDRVAALESAVVSCTRGVEKNSVDICDCLKHIVPLEQRLSKFDSEACENNASLNAAHCEGSPDMIGRLKHVETAFEQMQQLLHNQKDDLQAFYNRSQLDARFENLWASFIALLTRKIDHEVVDQKVVELRREVTDDFTLRISNVVRELQCAIEERVSVTEVRELLMGAQG